MKKFYAFALTVTLSLSATAINPRFTHAKAQATTTTQVPASRLGKTTGKASRPARLAVHKAAENDQAPVWRPRHNAMYYWDGTDWLLDGTFENVYDANGNLTVETSESADGYISRTTHTYNANNQKTQELTESLEKGQWVNYQKKEYEYDGDVTVSVISYTWNAIRKVWTVYNSDKYVVERDAAGNITSSTRMQSDIATGKIAMTYGADGKPEKIEVYSQAYDENFQEYLAVSNTYTNIVWQNFNGSIYSASDLFTVKNGIKSATSEAGGITSEITAEYLDARGSAIIRDSWIMQEEEDGYVYETKIVSTETYTVADEGFGGGKDVLEYQYLDPETDRLMYTERYIDTYITSVDDLPVLIYNALEYDLSEGGTFTEVSMLSRGIFTYDEAYGYPVDFVSQDFYMAGESGAYAPRKIVGDAEAEGLDGVWENTVRVTFTDYFNAAAGIDGIVADGDDSEAVYYNLQGVRVSNPSAGQLLIKVQGNKATKLLY